MWSATVDYTIYAAIYSRKYKLNVSTKIQPQAFTSADLSLGQAYIEKTIFMYCWFIIL